MPEYTTFPLLSVAQQTVLWLGATLSSKQTRNANSSVLATYFRLVGVARQTVWLGATLSTRQTRNDDVKITEDKKKDKETESMNDNNPQVIGKKKEQPVCEMGVELKNEKVYNELRRNCLETVCTLEFRNEWEMQMRSQIHYQY